MSILINFVKKNLYFSQNLQKKSTTVKMLQKSRFYQQLTEKIPQISIFIKIF